MITSESVKDLSFEASLKALEAVIETISSDKPDLNEIIQLYEEGVLYLNHCRAKLQQAETKISIIGKQQENFGVEADNG